MISRRHEAGSAKRVDGELGVVERAEREAGDHHERPRAALDRRPARSSRVPPVSVEPDEHPARALDQDEVVAGESGDRRPRARRRSGWQTPRAGRAGPGRAGLERASSATSMPPLRRATVATSLGSPVATPVWTGLTTTTRSPAPGTRREGRRRHGLADSCAGPGDDDDASCARGEPTSRSARGSTSVVGQGRRCGEPEPADAVRHRRRAEAADPNAVGCAAPPELQAPASAPASPPRGRRRPVAATPAAAATAKQATSAPRGSVGLGVDDPQRPGRAAAAAAGASPVS